MEQARPGCGDIKGERKLADAIRAAGQAAEVLMRKLRTLALLVALLLFPVTLNFMSPALSLQGAAEGIISGSLMLFAAMFAAAPLIGRLWCGWACPGGALQDLAAPINGRKPGRHAGNVRFAIWAAWFGTIAVLLAVKGIRQADFLYMTESGISVDEPFKYVIYFGVAAILLIVALLVGRRGSCHAICWMAPFMTCGMAAGHALSVPSLHIACDEAKCIRCGACSKACPMSLDPVASAISAKVPYECINCGECVSSCKKGALSFRFSARGR